MAPLDDHRVFPELLNRSIRVRHSVRSHNLGNSHTRTASETALEPRYHQDGNKVRAHGRRTEPNGTLLRQNLCLGGWLRSETDSDDVEFVTVEGSINVVVETTETLICATGLMPDLLNKLIELVSDSADIDLHGR